MHMLCMHAQAWLATSSRESQHASEAGRDMWCMQSCRGCVGADLLASSGSPPFVPQERERCSDRFDGAWSRIFFYINPSSRGEATNWWPEMDKIQNHMTMWRLVGITPLSGVLVTNIIEIIMAPSTTAPGNTRIWDWRVNAASILSPWPASCFE